MLLYNMMVEMYDQKKKMYNRPKKGGNAAAGQEADTRGARTRVWFMS